ncbi:MAG: DUF748 domain-containing protein [Bacteroidetes bacterium]|nr:DUF748 domain-containing protein [Bacteroidota bacterium]
MRIKVVQTPVSRARYRLFLYPLAIFLLFIVFAGFLAGKFLERQVKNAILEQNTGMNISFEDIHVNVISRSVRVTGLDIRVKADTTARVYLEKLEVKGFRVMPWFRARKIAMSELNSNGLVVSGKFGSFRDGFRVESRPDKDTMVETHADNKPGSLEIKNIRFTGLSMNLSHMPGGVFRVRCSDMDLEVDDLEFLFNDTVRAIPLNVGVFRMDVYEPFLVFKDGFYAVRASQIAMNTADSSLKVDTFRLVPQYSMKEFGEKHGLQTDRFDVNADLMQVSGIDYAGMIKDKTFYIEKILIDHLDANIFRDKNIPFDYNNFPALPQSLLRKIQVPMRIDKFLVQRSRIEYRELLQGSVEEGMVFLSDLDLGISNISSSQGAIPLKVDARALLYGQGRMNVSVIMPMDVTRDTFEFHGNLGRMDFAAFNPMAVPNGHIRFESGLLDSVYFEARANNQYASGLMNMLYQDVSVSLLNKKRPDMHKQGFLSFMANTVIHKSNLPGEDHNRVAEMYFQRDQNKGLINYLWKTVFSGMKNSMQPGGKVQRKPSSKEEGRTSD